LFINYIDFLGNLRESQVRNERSGSISSNNTSTVRPEQALQPTHARHSLSLLRGVSSSSTSDNNSDVSAQYTDSEPSRNKHSLDVANGKTFTSLILFPKHIKEKIRKKNS
jgi:hypothetical protein